MKQIGLEFEGILVRADEMRDEVFMLRTVIENFDVLGGLDEDLGVAGERRC